MIILAWAALAFALMLFPKSGERQNGIVWLPLSFLGCECIFAALAGIFSLVHIPVNTISIGGTSLVIAVALILYTLKGDRAQKYYWKKSDIILAAALGAFAVCFFLYRFCGEYIIAYATNDPADRISAAMHIVTEESVIYTWPNMYFGHTSNAMFIEALRPVFPGNLFFRAFEIKGVFNLWLGGLLFYAALRRYSEKLLVRLAFFLLTFLYVLAFPLNEALFGFNYLGISVELIIFMQIAAHMLLKQDISPKIALLLLSFGCFGIGASYTLFAPPLFIAAFIVVSYYILRVRGNRKAFIPIQLAVFAVPTALTFIYSVLLDPSGQEELGSQLLADGGIYFNLFTDALPYLPLALYAVWTFWKAARTSGQWVDMHANLTLPVVFLVYQAIFLVRLFMGEVSGYYYAKFNHVAWFFVLLLAGIGVVFLCEKYESVLIKRRLGLYAACWAALAAITLPFSAAALIEDEPLPVLPHAAASPYFIYADNFYRFSDASPYRSHYKEEFVALCAAAYELKQEQGITEFFTNSVEPLTDDASAWFWVDTLVNERIILPRKPIGSIDRFGFDTKTMLESDAPIWVVFRKSSVYVRNREYLDSFPKIYENRLGFVIEKPLA